MSASCLAVGKVSLSALHVGKGRLIFRFCASCRSMAAVTCRCLGPSTWGTAYVGRTFFDRKDAEVVMKSNQQWGKHLRELGNASLDPTIYALQWAQDPRCMQRGLQHRRVGAMIERNATVCRLWLDKPR